MSNESQKSKTRSGLAQMDFRPTLPTISSSGMNSFFLVREPNGVEAWDEEDRLRQTLHSAFFFLIRRKNLGKRPFYQGDNPMRSSSQLVIIRCDWKSTLS
jgi:hypothetical protein